VAAWVARAVVVGIAFAVGVALGQALADDPDSGRDRTYVRTVRPGTLPPAPETVTVTMTR